jgi:hypothetical protein
VESVGDRNEHRGQHEGCEDWEHDEPQPCKEESEEGEGGGDDEDAPAQGGGDAKGRGTARASDIMASYPRPVEKGTSKVDGGR